MNDFDHRIKITKDWVYNTWEKYPPKYFLSILWKNHPTSYDLVEKQTRHFRNCLLLKLYKKCKVSRLPNFPERVGLTTFHERSVSDVQLPNGGSVPVECFHSHIHLFNTENVIPNHLYLYMTIQNYCSRNILNGSQGCVVKEWNINHHNGYNFKDFYKYKYVQDGDLILDYKNTDILPLTSTLKLL